MNFFPEALHDSLMRAQWRRSASCEIYLKVVCHISYGCAAIFTDLETVWVGHTLSEQLMRQLQDTLGGVTLSTVEMLRIIESSASRNSVDIRRSGKLLEALFSSHLELLKGHDIPVTVILPCHEVGINPSDDKLRGTILKEVLVKPLIKMCAALSHTLSAVVSCGSISQSEVDVIVRQCKGFEWDFDTDALHEALSDVLMPSPAMDLSHKDALPRTTRCDFLEDLSMKRQRESPKVEPTLGDDRETADGPLHRDSEEKLKKYRRILRYFFPLCCDTFNFINNSTYPAL